MYVPVNLEGNSARSLLPAGCGSVKKTMVSQEYKRMMNTGKIRVLMVWWVWFGYINILYLKKINPLVGFIELITILGP
jgi:hypothetical protein